VPTTSTSTRSTATITPRRWRRRTAPLVGANTTSQIDDAVASLDLELTADEVEQLERPYTPRHDFQGVSDEAELQRIRDRIPGYAHA
jgi:hypothetical protein